MPGCAPSGPLLFHEWDTYDAAVGLADAIAQAEVEVVAAELADHARLVAERQPTRVNATTEKMRAKDRPLVNDNVTDEQFAALLEAWFFNFSRALVPGGSFFIWGGYSNLSSYPFALKKHELYFSQAIVWNKLAPVLSRKDFLGAFELCFYGWRLGAGHHFYGPNNVPDIWEVKKVSSQQSTHLTEKPVELATRALQYSSLKGQNVLDLFGGSGSTLIAAEQTERRAFLMEIDPLYADVIVQRWEAFKGKKAKRLKSSAATKNTPAEVAGVRKGGKVRA